MLRVDIEKWGEAKNKEMCSLMKHVADSHIDYHQKVSSMQCESNYMATLMVGT